MILSVRARVSSAIDFLDGPNELLIMVMTKKLQVVTLSTGLESDRVPTEYPRLHHTKLEY
jgi:hypothetical protein